MVITSRWSEAPSIDRHIQESLDAMSPRTHLLWNPTHSGDDSFGWEGRWEIWLALEDNAHPGYRGRVHVIDFERDRWDTDTQAWLRKLQTYENADGSFAPVDHGLLIGLDLADTWKSKTFFEDRIENPYDAAEARRVQTGKDAIRGAGEYYLKQDRPIVGRYVNSGHHWRVR